MDFNQIKKKLFISLILGIIIVVALGIYSDFSKIITSIMNFNFWYLPLILMLAPLNYFFRYIKWNYYLRLLGIEIETGDNIKVFTAGLGMTVTPGKVGEFLKAYLIKEINGIPASAICPLVLVERVTDGISMIILASVGALKFKYGIGILISSAMLVVLFVAFVRFRSFALAVISLLKKLPVLNKIGQQIDAFYKSSYELLNMRSVLFSVGIGVISWAFEGIIIYLALKAFNTPVSVLSSIFIVSFSTIVGAISMLPGGLFAAEGSIMGLLVMMGVPKEIASATTIITRFSTLWLGVAIGIVGLISVQKKIGKRRMVTNRF